MNEALETREIFAGHHNEDTIIRVLYGRDAGDARPGLDIVLSGQVKARYYRPEDVNAWFAQWSKKLIEPWRAAYHASGLGADSFTDPAPTDVLLDVPYYSQRDNYYDPFGSCNVTMYAMAGAYYGVERKYGDRFKQLEDDMNRYIKDNRMSRHTHDDLALMGRAYGLNSRFNVNRTFAQIENQLRLGNPVGISGSFTKSGHIILIIGLRGLDFVVHDPFGNALKSYKDDDGKALVYPREYMNQKMRFNNKPEKWAHFFGDAK